MKNEFDGLKGPQLFIKMQEIVNLKAGQNPAAKARLTKWVKAPGQGGHILNEFNSTSMSPTQEQVYRPLLNNLLKIAG